MGIERRRHQRQEIAIEIRVRGKDRTGRPFEESTLSGNISSSGCSLFTSFQLIEGSHLELEFLRFVSGRPEPLILSLSASVVRSTPVNETQYVVGVQFLNDVFPIEVLAG